MGEQKRRHVAATITKAMLLGMELAHDGAAPKDSVAVYVRSKVSQAGGTAFVDGIVVFETLYQAAVYHLGVHGVSYAEITASAGRLSGRTLAGLSKRRRKRRRLKSEPESSRVAQR